jgi:hypothetical protein
LCEDPSSIKLKNKFSTTKNKDDADSSFKEKVSLENLLGKLVGHALVEQNSA